MRVLFLILVAAILATPAMAQFQSYMDDAQRLATPGIGIGPRAVGMGSAYVPIADDYTALYWNPAGLAQINAREITVGFSNRSYGDNAAFLGQNSSSSVNSMQLDHLGLVYPVERRSGGFSIAFGYNRTANFSSVASFDALNPNSSLIGYQVKNSPADGTLSLPYQTGVAGIVNGSLVTPVAGGLTQTGNYLEDGGMHAFSIGAGVEVTDGLNLGFALHFYSGSYSYQLQYRETDLNNQYNAFDSVNWTNVDLYQYAENANYTTDISGIGAEFGLQYNWLEMGSFGLTVALPTSYHVDETYTETAQASFDNGTFSNIISNPGNYSYDLTTPMTVSGGLAVHPIRLLTISASADYIDYTQMRFSNASDLETNDNPLMRTTFRAALNYHFGAEYKIAPLGLGVRAGYQFLESAVAADASSDGQHILSGGVSVVIGKRALLELAVAHNSTKASHVNYDATSALAETVTQTTVMLGFSYRY